FFHFLRILYIKSQRKSNLIKVKESQNQTFAFSQLREIYDYLKISRFLFDFLVFSLSSKKIKIKHKQKFRRERSRGGNSIQLKSDGVRA
ncbi:MAG: hypothetical protein SOZ93_04940, partial [Eubacteriales bacterium]|nr:hypothetical protein [Eubacteriales bacterium]